MNLTRKDEPIALGEAEVAFAMDILGWLCQERIIGSIAMRNALLAIRRYDPGTRAGPAFVEVEQPAAGDGMQEG